jgi:hypothetical protein
VNINEKHSKMREFEFGCQIGIIEKENEKSLNLLFNNNNNNNNNNNKESVFSSITTTCVQERNSECFMF